MAVIKHDVVCTITEVYGTLASAAEDMKCLAVFAEKRLSDLPDVPTVNEVLEKMDLEPISPLSNFRFYMVKKSMKEQYPKRWEMLTEALKKANLNPEYQKRMKQQKLKIIWIGPKETTEQIHEADQVLQKFSQFWK
jgi:tripartite-type tricarboxylate transporter receptor subunit TctC